MLKASHVNVGATVALSSVIVTGGTFSPFLLFYPLLSLLDDADHHSSSATKALGLQLPGATHRGYSHSLFFNAVVAILIFAGFFGFYSLTQTDFYVLLAISFSHLLGDVITKRKIPAFYPFYKGNVGIPLITTGSIAEKIITFILSFVNIGLVYYIISHYIITGAYTLATYDITFIAIAVISQAFVTYLLLKDEITYFKKNIGMVISHMGATMVFMVINFVVLFLADKFLIKTGVIDLTGLVSSTGFSLEIVTTLLFVLGMTPSMINTIRRIDVMAFPFASSVNVVISFALIVFFTVAKFIG